MIVAVTSDTHGRQGWIIPECDVFIHAGDITAGGSRIETRKFAKAIQGFLDRGTVKHVILVPGNHDRCFERQQEDTLGFFPDPRIHVLINQGVEIDGKKFWGSPNTPVFMQWYFMSTEEELAKIYESMPGNLDVLITHGPPRGILDPGYNDPHVGSLSLLTAVASRTGHIKHHVFGHLHGAGGKSVFNDPYGPTFHNVAACNEAYQLVNQPLILEI